MNHRGPIPFGVLVALILTVPIHSTAQQDALSLEGLVVTAAPTPLAAEMVASHVTVLDRAELARHTDRTLGEVLRDVAGLDVVRNGSYGAATSVFLRGGESDHTLVLVDGVQVNQAGGGFDFSTLTTENVERIEIVRGPASALYGSDAVTGVIHVITRTGRGGARGSVAFEAGSYGRRDWSADLEAGTDRAGYAVALARRRGDGVLAVNNRHVASTFSGKAHLLADDRTELTLSLRWTEHEFHFPTDGSGAIVDTNQFTFGDQATVQASVRRSLGDRLTLQALVGLNETDGGTDDRPDEAADTLGFFAFSSLDRFRRASAELRAVVEAGAAALVQRIAERVRPLHGAQRQRADESGWLRARRPRRASRRGHRGRADRGQRALRTPGDLAGRRDLARDGGRRPEAAGFGGDRHQGADLLRELRHRIRHGKSGARTGAIAFLGAGARPVGPRRTRDMVGDLLRPAPRGPHPVHLHAAVRGRPEFLQHRRRPDSRCGVRRGRVSGPARDRRHAHASRYRGDRRGFRRGARRDLRRG